MLRRLGTLIGYFSDNGKRTWTAVALTSTTLAAVEFLVHEITTNSSLPVLSAGAVDALLLGASGGAMVWMLLTGNRDRRRRVRLELERIAELNHEIRNALQVISHSHHNADSEHRDMVMESVTRIDAVLKRVFPVVGGHNNNSDRGTVTTTKPPRKNS